MDIFLSDCPKKHIHLGFCDTSTSVVFESLDEFVNFLKICRGFAQRIGAKYQIPNAFLRGWESEEDSKNK